MQKKNDLVAAFVYARAWRMAHHSQRGLAHEQSGRPNEDTVACSVSDSDVLMVAVADGVGSGEQGDLASALVARHWVDVQIPAEPAASLQLGHQTLVGCEAVMSEGLQAAGVRAHGSSGSMFVGAWLFPSGEIVLGHVGDCRAYRLHGGDLLPLTRDHSYQNLGLQQPAWRKPDDPARMIGGGMMGLPDVQRVRLEFGDWLLLCSDGLHAALTHAQLTQAIRQALEACHPVDRISQDFLKSICLHLAELAVRAGGRDDISVVLARFEGVKTKEPTNENFANFENDFFESVWPSDVLRTAAS